MSRHPSLTASFNPPPPLRPLPKMGRKKLCWCKSGLKYDECHLDRDKQPPVNIFELEAKMRADLHDGYCSHPHRASCSGTVINAHTVQKNGGLAAIAEDGHVLTVKPTMKDLKNNEGKPKPRSIGVGKASVFPGFCGVHDDAVFKPIEGKSLLLDKNTAFLFAYRAMAYERFGKEAQKKSAELQRQLDKGKPFEQQASIQEYVQIYIEGVRRGMKDAHRWKKQFDERLLSGARGDFNFVACRFDRVLPVVACGGLPPTFDFQGNPLQRVGRGNSDLDHMTLTVTAFESQTIAVLGWIGSPKGPAAGLATSYLKVENDRKADALIRLLFISLDNIFLKPSWWAGLPTTSQEQLTGLVESGTPAKGHSGDELSNDAMKLFTATVDETAGFST